MRITCPNCTASFDVPTELLGKKGRSLKCATCGHSWYQTPHVETIDLAEIMGQEYAARAKADMGPVGPSAAAAPPPGKAGAAPPAGRSLVPPPAPASAAPLGVSLMRKDLPPAQTARPTAQSWNTKLPGAPGAPPRPAAPVPAGTAPSWYQPEKPQKIAPPPPGAPSWYQPEPAKVLAPPGASGAPSWYQPDPAAQRPVGPERVLQHQGDPAAPMRGGGVLPGVATAPPMRGGGVLAAGADPRLGPAAAALSGQSLRGQAGAGAVGDANVSWMQQPNAPQGGVMAAPLGGAPGAMMAPQGPVAAALRGQSMVGQAGALIPGDRSVSWNERAPPPGVPAGQPGQPAQSLMGQAGAGIAGDRAVSWNERAPGPPPGMPGAALGQSLMGQAGAGVVGDSSVSWVQQPGTALAPQAPGAPAVSQMTGGIQAPGLAAQSMLDGTVRAPGQPGQSMMGQAAQGPGAPAVSQMTGAIQGPGLAAQSMLDGTIQAPGLAAQSMLDGTVQAPGQPGQSTLQAPGSGPGAPGVSQLGQTGGPGMPGQSMMAPAAGSTAVAATAAEAAGGATTAALATGKADSTVALIPGETKAKDDGAAATKETAGEAAPPLWSGAKEDEELVDPDADRPDFGASEEAAAAAEDEEAEDEDTEDEAGADGAARVNLKPERQIDPAFITAGLMLVAVLSVAMLLWLERGPLAKAWPGFDAIYSKLGLESKRPGEGLRLTQSGMRLLRIGGIETLVVKGYISNISDTEKPVANIRLQLVDGSNQVVQQTSTPPAQSKLAPGASIDFEIKLELPNMAAAKSVVVNWGG